MTIATPEHATLKSEAAVLAALAMRFAAPEYAFLQHVRNGTGYTRRVTRTADALAFSLWPSRGLELHGFEVKVSRSDWLREKLDPAKSESIQQFCHRWWIAAGDPRIVQPGELPPTWGLLVPKGDKLVAKTEAPKLEAKPLDLPMLAAILRNASETMVPRMAVDEIVDRRTEARLQIELDKVARRDGTIHLRAELDALKQTVAKFEAASGVKIESWDAGKVGEAVAMVRKGMDAKSHALASIEMIERCLDSARRQIKDAKRGIEEGT